MSDTNILFLFQKVFLVFCDRMMILVEEKGQMFFYVCSSCFAYICLVIAIVVNIMTSVLLMTTQVQGHNGSLCWT